MIYNIVDSVKGGCGKTTFSIMLSLIADGLNVADRGMKETRSCLIDMDIQGSALMYQLFGKTYFDIEEKEKKFKCLNDRIMQFDDFNEANIKYIHRFEFKNKISEGIDDKPREIDIENRGDGVIISDKACFDVVCCDSRQEKKNKFRSMSNQNYSPEILYSTFRMGLINMLSTLEGQTEYSHKYIIFDMPPNADGYSDAVYDAMLKSDYSVMRKGMDVCNLFLVQTMDMGQRAATLEYFKSFIEKENFQKIHRIFFVFNDMFFSFEKGEEKISKDLFADAVAQVKGLCAKSSFSDEIKKKIYFLSIKFNKDYCRMCSQQDGICNVKRPKDFLGSIRCIENMISDEKVEGASKCNERLLDLMKEDK